MSKRDYSSDEFKRLVILGESTVQGGSWLERQDQRFADIVARLIDACQCGMFRDLGEGTNPAPANGRNPETKAHTAPANRKRGAGETRPPSLSLTSVFSALPRSQGARGRRVRGWE